MIAFDNGPADGDYVRYIDDLMKRAALSASAGTLRGPDGAGSDAETATRSRAVAADASRRAPQATGNPDRGKATPVTAAGRAPAVTGPARPSMVDSGQTTGFVAPSASTRSASAAAAIASALMSGEVGNRAVLSMRAKVGLAAIAFGATLIVIGLFWEPLNPIFLVAGVVVIVWAVRMMRDAAGRAQRAMPSDRAPGSG